MKTYANADLNVAEVRELTQAAADVDMDPGELDRLLKTPSLAREWLDRCEGKAQLEYDRQREEGTPTDA